MKLNYITRHRPLDKKRQQYCANGEENHLTEPAVMIAFAMHVIGRGATDVRIFPDGEHGKRFDIRAFLESLGFVLAKPEGKTTYAGEYRRGADSLIVAVRSGQGDVTAEVGGRALLAECKGGVTNSGYAGLVARLRRGLCEAVGLLMARPLDPRNERQVAVVPATEATRKLARQMCSRSTSAGIEIALAHDDGTVEFLDEHLQH